MKGSKGRTDDWTVIFLEWLILKRFVRTACSTVIGQASGLDVIGQSLTNHIARLHAWSEFSCFLRDACMFVLCLIVCIALLHAMYRMIFYRGLLK